MVLPAQISHVCVAQVVCRQAQVFQDTAFLDNGGEHLPSLPPSRGPAPRVPDTTPIP